jgi:hypothetical protein
VYPADLASLDLAPTDRLFATHLLGSNSRGSAEGTTTS